MEVILGKALVADPGSSARRSRRACTGASQHGAFHVGSSAAADESHLDHGADFEVDVSLSMFPPDTGQRPAAVVDQDARAPARGSRASRASGSGPDPYAMAVIGARAGAARRTIRRRASPISRLASRPIRDRATSSSKTAWITVLQRGGAPSRWLARLRLVEHPARHVFERRAPIEEWEEFSSFAEHRKLNREIVAEKKAIEQVVVAEAQGQPLQDADRRRRAGASSWAGRGLVLQGARRSQRRHRGRGRAGHQHRIGRWSQGRRQESRRPGHRARRHPLSVGRDELRGRTRSLRRRDQHWRARKGQADLPRVSSPASSTTARTSLPAVHRRACTSTSVPRCQNGRAVGVTVTTDPPNGGIAGCIAVAHPRHELPSNPKLDVATTRF